MAYLLPLEITAFVIFIYHLSYILVINNKEITILFILMQVYLIADPLNNKLSTKKIIFI